MKAQAKKKPQKHSQAKKWLIVSAVLVVILIGIPALLFTPGSTKPIEEIADRFEPQNDWVLSREKIVPPQLFCLEGVGCNELLREWRTPQLITSNELLSILQQTGWSYQLRENCDTLDEPNKDDREFLCTVTYQGENNYQGYIYVKSTNGQYSLYLDLFD